MLSKIVGQSYGISKGTQVTIVRIPQGIPSAAELAQLNGRPFGNIFRHMATMDAMLKVGQDVVQRNLQFKAVINLSLGSIEPTGTMPTPGHPLWSYYNLIEQLINAGVVIVQSSGNDGWAFDQNVCYPRFPSVLELLFILITTQRTTRIPEAMLPNK
jgi:hypothetical protein